MAMNQSKLDPTLRTPTTAVSAALGSGQDSILYSGRLVYEGVPNLVGFHRCLRNAERREYALPSKPRLAT